MRPQSTLCEENAGIFNVNPGTTTVLKKSRRKTNNGRTLH